MLFQSHLPVLNPNARLGIELEGWFPASRQSGVRYEFSAQRRKARECLFEANVAVADLRGKRDDFSKWQVISEGLCTDKTKDGNRNITEILSPITTDVSGLRDIQRVFASLKRERFKTNLICGLHVHVSRMDGPTTVNDFMNIRSAFKKNWEKYGRWIAPDRRRVWPADRPDDALNYCLTYGTVEWKAMETAAYADPTIMHYIVGVANFTIAAMENKRADIKDYLTPAVLKQRQKSFHL